MNSSDESISLEKNKPIYLAAWLGTTKSELNSGRSENGEPPSGIEDVELAFLYKVLLTDKESNFQSLKIQKLFGVTIS